MNACTMANGSVFFAPDEIERKAHSTSYVDIVSAVKTTPEKSARRFSLFGRRKKTVPTAPITQDGAERRAL
ncbi:MAG: hypothetical protein IT559_08340 [Alphaproteobacteria bacterium]|nr:hypothetical protein [Alphaproteobacteria bacterium]